MRLVGENSAQVAIKQKTLSSDLIEVEFSCEWCAGRFEFFSTKQDLEKLLKLCVSISTGKKKGSWLSEEGDLELKFSKKPTGQVHTKVICFPSANLSYHGKLEFEVDLEISSFENLSLR